MTSEEPMDVGKLNGRTLYVGGAKGIDELAEEHGKPDSTTCKSM